MLKALQGKKTYIVAAAAILLGLAGAFLGLLDHGICVLLVVFGLGAFGLRDGMKTEIARALVDRAAAEGAEHRSGTKAPAAQPFVPQRRNGE